MVNKINMMEDIAEVLVDEEALQAKIKAVGAQISRDYCGKCPILVGILKGVVPFYAAMAQAITIPMEQDFMSISSYSGTQSTGVITYRKDLDLDIEGRDVLILEDILDSGRTLKAVTDNLLQRKPASLKICTLLDKPDGRVVELDADYVCFTIPDSFVVGFGLDYDEYYRNLPFVGILKPSVYQDK